MQIWALITISILSLLSTCGAQRAEFWGQQGVVHAPPVIATLPQVWANPSVSCNPPGAYDVEKTIPGDYAATWTGFNQAITDWVAAPDQWWRVKITHGTLITGNSHGTLTAKPIGAGLPTKCLVFESDTPLTAHRTVCSHGIQDNVATATDPGIRNPDCNGTGMSYQLGTTVTAISPGAFVLANGTATNTSAYNDVASMYTLESTTTNIQGVVQAGAPDVNGNGPSHIVIRDAEIRLASSIACCTPVFMQTSPTTLAELPTSYGFDRVWIHGDATDAGAGTNSLSNDAQVECGGNCWFINSQISKSIRPGAEGHGVYWQAARGLMVDHNWIEGTSIGIFDGGIMQAVVTGPSGTDIQITRNRSTYPKAWLGNGSGAGSVCGTNISCVRKNALEFKGCNRCLIDGNILENSDNSGGQLGRIVGLNNRACPTGVCDNYLQTIQNITFTNNILRHGCRGWEHDPSSGSNGSGYSAVIPARNLVLANSLIYDISIMNPGCDSVATSGSLNMNGSGHDFAVTSVTQNSAGTISTIQLTGGTGENQTGIVAGDPIYLTGCTDTTFEAGPYPFVYALSVSGTVITYPNTASTPNATTTCTDFYTKIGWPNYLQVNHVTSIGGANLVCMGSTNTAIQAIYSRNQIYTNNICAGSGGFAAIGQLDGTNFSNGWLDSASLTLHHSVFSDRVATTWQANTVYKLGAIVQPTGSPTRFFRAVTSGTSGSSQPAFSGTQFSCATDNTVVWQQDSLKMTTSGGLPLYTQYSTIGSGTTPPTNLYFPMNDACYGATADSTCIGFSGAMSAPSTGTFACTAGTPVDNWNPAIDLSDWNGYALHSSSSFHNAASDGTDMGASIPTIRSSQTVTPYTCNSACGTGPRAN